MAESDARDSQSSAPPPEAGGARGAWMRGRTALILLLAAGSILTEALLVYYSAIFSSPLYNANPTLNVVWRKGDLVVTQILDPAVAGGFRKGDRVLSVVTEEGREIPARGPADGAEVARAVRFGEPFKIKVLRKDEGGRDRVVAVPYPAVASSSRLGILPRLAAAAPSLVIFLACLAAALLIGLSRPGDEGAFAASMMFFCFGALNWHGNFGIFPEPFRFVASFLWIVLYALVTPTLLWFCLRFPSPSPIDLRVPWLKRMGVAFGFVFGAWNGALWAIQNQDQAAYVQYLDAVRYYDWVLDVVFCLLAVVGIAALLLNLKRASSHDERRRLTILLCGILGLFPWLLNYLLAVTVGIAAPTAFLIFVNCAMLLFPVAFIYAVVRHRIFGIRVILRRGLRFALLSRGFLFVEGAAIFALLFFAAGPSVARVAGGSHGGTLTVAIAAVTAAIVAVIRKANTRVMAPMERRFFREAYDARAVLTSLTLGVRRLVGDPDALAEASVRTASDALHPRSTSLFLKAGLLSGLPSESERARRVRRAASREAPGDFLCFWISHGEAPKDDAGESAALPYRLSEDSCLVALLALGGAPTAPLNLDPKDRRSAAAELARSCSPGERHLLEGTLGTRLAVPLSVGEELLGFLCLGEKLSEEPYSREDETLLSALAQQMADTLDHARLLHQSEEQAQIRREVEIAQQVQRNLLPAEPPSVPGLDLSGACRPARYVGGDYYDFIRSGERGVALALGDISGKGISAALLMAALQATLREKADTLGRQPSAVIAGVNRRLCASAGEGRFATLFYGVLDAESRTLDYASAGHNPPVLFRAAAGAGVVHLEPTGTVVGVFPETTYGQRRVPVEPGDILIVYSDGITEAMNEAAEFFEEERLLALLPSLTGLTAAQARDRILSQVEAFTGPAPQADDITLIVARVL